VLGAGQSAVIADVSEDTAFPIDERMRILGGRPARFGASRRRSPAKAQRPPVGGGTDRQHGWQTTDPLCWRYAGCEILAILAHFRELRLGSGPRGRRFKSSRPDQLYRKTLGNSISHDRRWSVMIGRVRGKKVTLRLP
jgi:hypothetical protein